MVLLCVLVAMNIRALGADGRRGDIAAACFIPDRAISELHLLDDSSAPKPALHGEGIEVGWVRDRRNLTLG